MNQLEIKISNKEFTKNMLKYSDLMAEKLKLFSTKSFLFFMKNRLCFITTIETITFSKNFKKVKMLSFGTVAEPTFLFRGA